MWEQVYNFVPPLIEPGISWFMTKFRGMKFIEPPNGYQADQDWITLNGEYLKRGNTDHCIFTKHEGICWPQQAIIYEEKNKKWTA